MHWLELIYRKNHFNLEKKCVLMLFNMVENRM